MKALKIIFILIESMLAAINFHIYITKILSGELQTFHFINLGVGLFCFLLAIGMATDE